MATKRGEKRRIDDNERFSKRSTEVNKKTIEKLLRTNSQIISKLEVLITRQKNSKPVSRSIEKKLNDNNKNNNNTIDPEQQHEAYEGHSRCSVKDVMYSVFAIGHKLPSINTQASPSKIQEWKTYAISICETYLNPNNQNIQMSESIMKSKIINNLQKLENRDKFTHSDDDSHDGNDVDDGGDRAADDRAGAADDGRINDGSLTIRC
ncbi:uncharacterized protein OCT59_029732 [Rhizophagus irregularis]|uniref:uncharacterized protein n=1 Tax=Rhizophagus irregularis TaxID=588596 RepID=UPI00332128F6|nr:hypothetical protein OCT59_029732 [Rhizophagus irregularis]